MLVFVETSPGSLCDCQTTYTASLALASIADQCPQDLSTARAVRSCPDAAIYPLLSFMRSTRSGMWGTFEHPDGLVRASQGTWSSVCTARVMRRVTDFITSSLHPWPRFLFLARRLPS
jgi:hypothetical protein